MRRSRTAQDMTRVLSEEEEGTSAPSASALAGRVVEAAGVSPIPLAKMTSRSGGEVTKNGQHAHSNDPTNGSLIFGVDKMKG